MPQRPTWLLAPGLGRRGGGGRVGQTRAAHHAAQGRRGGPPGRCRVQSCIGAGVAIVQAGVRLAAELEAPGPANLDSKGSETRTAAPSPTCYRLHGAD